ncbi:MAG: L-threonylcarbamoyladenylate synthase [Bacteroidetes bacterium]|nr:L-threonylcarbamoyladenylate synthase [Bacteroidota bacterium]MCL5267569.1 L-threonylcarbamoyladenylate synthase [Bacteroidota bacterium]
MVKVVGANFGQSVTRAAQVILNGGVIVYPTETIYGLGANALETKAVEKVFEIKARSQSNPILVLIPNLDTLDELVLEIPEVAKVLMDKFWPGPLTIVFKASPIVSTILTANSGKIGIRLSSDEFCRELLDICEIPITSTSANLSGEPNPNRVGMINRRVLNSVDLIVDAGELVSQTPSTVVDITEGEIHLIREGTIPYKNIVPRS